MANAKRHVAPARRPIAPERLTVIIPAAGIGKRMKSKGPKALLPVFHGMSILEIEVRTILGVYPNADIIVVGGFECDKIRDTLWGDFPIRIVRNTDYEKTNVTQSVSLGLEASLPGGVLILHGDLVFNAAAIQGLAGEQSALLLVDKQLDSSEVGIGQQDGFVTTLSYALNTKWGQIAYLNGKELNLFRDIVWHSRMSHQWFLFEALNQVISQGGQFLAYQPGNAKVVEIDRLTDLEKAKQI